MIIGICSYAKALRDDTAVNLGRLNIDEKPLMRGPCFHADDIFVKEVTSNGGHGPFGQTTSIAARDDFVSVFTGRIFNSAELKDLVNPQEAERWTSPAEWILGLYQKLGGDFVKQLNGGYAISIWDRHMRRLHLFRDHFGIEPFYYYFDSRMVVFSSRISWIFEYTKAAKELDTKALINFLLYNYNLGYGTFFKNVFKVSPANHLVFDEHKVSRRRYWQLDFSKRPTVDENEIADELHEQLQHAVGLRVGDQGEKGVLLSGGMDSSSVLAFTRKLSNGRLTTLSYRCEGKSFDESYYAKIMAEFVGSRHVQVEFCPADVMLITDIVKLMDEPFCDVGINIASYILGRSAHQNELTCLLTGDGGDELFGGHPVYEADKIAGYCETIPNSVKSLVFSLMRRLPDSDQKKNWVVKLKRFAESCEQPAELLSHRWRTYYSRSEMRELLSDELAENIELSNMYDDLLEINQEAAGPDLLSRCISSDYQTVVGFYLRRNDLNRKFGLETRFPMLDHRLVEFCAAIPSHLKIRGWFDTKYILKKAMKNILPADIIFRKDKLGHSIPMKRWLREDSAVQTFILDNLVEETVKRRGLFSSRAIQNMLSEHMAKRRNNSHRIWSLLVLELWLQENFDRNPS